ncbi:MAG: hypothetical protein ACLFR2_07725 [Candidatus Kapaibacterium sp.]
MKTCLIILAAGFLSIPLYSLDKKAEDIFELIARDADNTEILEILEYYTENPVNLHESNQKELILIPLINERESLIVLDLADSLDSKPSKDLLISSGYTELQAEVLLLCTMYKKAPRPELNFRSRIRADTRLNKARGFTEKKYAGGPESFYQRYLAEYGGFSAMLLADKDAGEISMTDRYSGYASYSSSVFKIIAGDFSAECGMGSVLWNAFGMRKGVETAYPAVQRGKGIRPYRSSADFYYFRGAAAQINNELFGGSLMLNAFYSNTNKSGTIDYKRNEISSLYTSGYFRTESELEKKSALSEKTALLNAEYSRGSFSTGITLFNINYPMKVNSSSSSMIKGCSSFFKSIYSFHNSKSSILANELSLDGRGHHAFISGAAFFGSETRIGVSFRHISAGFRSPYGYHFGEFSSISNEAGIYFGIGRRFGRRASIAFYADFYRSLERTYLYPGILKGSEFFIEADYEISIRNEITFRIKHEKKGAVKTINDIKYIYPETKTYSRIEFRHKPLNRLELRYRLEAVNTDFDSKIKSETGAAGFAEINLLPLDWLKIGARTALFDTESFESAVWQFEYTAPGLISSKALYGSGSRFFLYFRAEIFGFARLNARYSVTEKYNTRSIGSGYDEIPGTVDIRFLIQLDLTL